MAELRSGIYSGRVSHRRLSVRYHAFSYRVFMVLADIDRLPEFVSRSCWWSLDRFNLASFRQTDFLPAYSGSLRQKVSTALQQAGFAPNDGAVFMLANWRYFGFLINPISCFYCYNADHQLQYMILEVTNTPWGERQLYVLNDSDQDEQGQLTFAKTMHVSPFYPMDMQYRLNSCAPGESLRLHLDLYRQQDKMFDATLSLQRQEPTRAVLTRVLLMYPLMTLKVAVAIYWQAAKLYLKGVVVHPHPAKYRGEQ